VGYILSEFSPYYGFREIIRLGMDWRISSGDAQSLHPEEGENNLSLLIQMLNERSSTFL